MPSAITIGSKLTGSHSAPFCAMAALMVSVPALICRCSAGHEAVGSACAWRSGWLAQKAFSFSGSGLPVAGSGRIACIRSKKVCGVAAPKTGVLSIAIWCSCPSGSLKASAMPRPLRAVPGALGLRPDSEKRATTGTGLPENSAEREYAAASGVPTNSPRAQVPLMWLRRSPGVTPKAPSIASTTSGAETSPAASACGEIRSTPAAMAGAASRTGFSFIFIIPVWGVV
mgnify:CR=1 FL=1